jgi:DNA-binding Lrp family transcriptional regulator
MYLKFTQLLEGLEASLPFPRLDQVEKKLLEFIFAHEKQGKPLLVGDVIYVNAIASQATLHRRIVHLEKEGLIRYGADIDGRKKCIELTPKARDYWAKLGQCVLKAAGK